jgi:hypothetical protein
MVKPLNNLKKQVNEDHMKNATLFQASEPPSKSADLKNEKNQVFTSRPPKELEKMDDGNSDIGSGKNTLFEKAVEMGVVNIKDTIAKQSYNPNHESIRVLKNRANVEKQYEGLFIPKDADQPNIPERFLNDEQKKRMFNPEILKQERLKKKTVNSFGLFDSRAISDLIIDYKVYGQEKLVKKAKEKDISDANIQKFQQFIDNNILNLPTHKVTLQESIDPESKQIKQKLVIVKDDWVKDIKDDIEREKNSQLDSKPSTSKKNKEIFEQFKMLENLVSRSQITTKESNSPNETTETIMKRPKKQLVKEVTKML